MTPERPSATLSKRTSGVATDRAIDARQRTDRACAARPDQATPAGDVERLSNELDALRAAIVGGFAIVRPTPSRRRTAVVDVRSPRRDPRLAGRGRSKRDRALFGRCRRSHLRRLGSVASISSRHGQRDNDDRRLRRRPDFACVSRGTARCRLTRCAADFESRALGGGARLEDARPGIQRARGRDVAVAAAARVAWARAGAARHGSHSACTGGCARQTPS